MSILRALVEGLLCDVSERLLKLVGNDEKGNRKEMKSLNAVNEENLSSVYTKGFKWKVSVEMLLKGLEIS